MTARTARTRSRSSPSRPPSFSLSRRNPRAAAFSARRAVSSGSPSHSVHDVGGPSRRNPSSRWTGNPASFPCRSCSAASTAPRAACSPGGSRASTASSAQGSSPSSTPSSHASPEPTDSSYRAIGAPCPNPETPSWRISTSTSSAASCDPRAIVKVSASGRVTVRAESSKAVTLVPLRAPVAQGIERSPPERKVAGSIPAGRTLLTSPAKPVSATPSRSRRPRAGSAPLARASSGPPTLSDDGRQPPAELAFLTKLSSNSDEIVGGLAITLFFSSTDTVERHCCRVM